MKYDGLITHIKDGNYQFAGMPFTSDGVDLESDVDALVASPEYVEYFSQQLMGASVGGKVVLLDGRESLNTAVVDVIKNMTITDINNLKTSILADESRVDKMFDSKLVTKTDIAADMVVKAGFEVANIYKRVFTLPCGKILAELV